SDPRRARRRRRRRARGGGGRARPSRRPRPGAEAGADGARRRLAQRPARRGGRRPRRRGGAVSPPIPSEAESLGLSSAALPLVADLVHERLGVVYGPQRFDTLADRLAPLVLERSFDSFLDYFYLLKYDASSVEEWRRVMDALSVAETYFWREIDQLR